MFRKRGVRVGGAAVFFATAAALLCAGPAFGQSAGVAAPRVKTGIDVLEEQNFAPLKGKRIGLITNQTGVDSQGRRTIDVLAHAEGVKLVALFSPEHGIAGKLDQEHVDNSKDAATGVPIFSLYGALRRPADEDLKGLDALVFDIQDSGVRFYTYTATMGLAMEAAAKNHVAFFVLDRPNPLGGVRIEGPMLDADKTAFVAYFPTPIIYGMTLGELARYYNAEKKIGASLQVIRMEGWKRRFVYGDTGLAWIAPSPNLRTVSETLPYPGIEILQAGGVSVGRGTATPFEVLGAPWVRGEELAAALRRRGVAGVTYRATTFTPASDLYKGVECGGVALTVNDAAAFQSMRNGLEIAEALEKLYPGKLDIAKMITLVGNAETIAALEKGVPVSEIVAGWKTALDAFGATRAKYLIYE